MSILPNDGEPRKHDAYEIERGRHQPTVVMEIMVVRYTRMHTVVVVIMLVLAGVLSVLGTLAFAAAMPADKDNPTLAKHLALWMYAFAVVVLSMLLVYA